MSSIRSEERELFLDEDDEFNFGQRRSFTTTEVLLEPSGFNPRLLAAGGDVLDVRLIVI